MKPPPGGRSVVWDLDASELPDGKTLDDGVREFWDLVEEWGSACRGAEDSTWRCPVAWRRMSEARFVVRGVILLSLGRALRRLACVDCLRIQTRDPLLGLLARAMAREQLPGDVAVQLRLACGWRRRLASRLEPPLLAAWWCLNLALRWMARRRVRIPAEIDGLLLEPLVAGSADPTVHNWGAVDPLPGARSPIRVQVPVGFGLRVLLMRGAASRIPGAVLPEDVVSSSEMAAMLAVPANAMRLWPTRASIDGVNLQRWSLAMRRRLCFSTTLQAAAFTDAAVRSIRRNTRLPAAVACWFENQPQERAFVRAVRHAQPGVEVTGYLLYHFSELSHRGIIPTRREMECTATPDLIRCCGSAQRDWLRRRCPWVKIEAASPGRFRVPRLIRDPSWRSVLLVTPSDDDAALLMVHMVREASPAFPPGWQVRIRLHPANGRRPRRQAGQFRMTLDDRASFGAALGGVSIVVGGGSSALVIARAAGWPVAVLAPRGMVGMDPFSAAPRLQGVARIHSADSLSAFIRSSGAAEEALRREDALFT